MSITSRRSGSVILTEEYFDCICLLSLSMDVLDVEIISCTTCKRQYHAPCHGYLSRDAASQSAFTCIYCDTNDQTLQQFNRTERPLLARVRLILYFMDKLGKLPANILMLLSEKDRKIVMEKLKTFKLLTKGSTFDVSNRATLQHVLPKFFIMDSSQLLQ